MFVLRQSNRSEVSRLCASFPDIKPATAVSSADLTRFGSEQVDVLKRKINPVLPETQKKELRCESLGVKLWRRLVEEVMRDIQSDGAEDEGGARLAARYRWRGQDKKELQEGRVLTEMGTNLKNKHSSFFIFFKKEKLEVPVQRAESRLTKQPPPAACQSPTADLSATQRLKAENKLPTEEFERSTRLSGKQKKQQMCFGV